LVEPECVGCTRVSGEWRRKRDDLADLLGSFLGELAGEDTSEAPADKTDLLAMLVGKTHKPGPSKLITCPETVHLEVIEFEDTTLGTVIAQCSRLTRC